VYLLALDITLSLIDCNQSEGYCEQNKQKWWIAKGSLEREREREREEHREIE
jgi:hypothetical protein